MKLIIERASDRLYCSDPPIESAKKEMVDHKQTNHGIERTFPKRDEVWTIEINSLEELAKFISKHGDIIIYGGGDINKLVIYDSYVE